MFPRRKPMQGYKPALRRAASCATTKKQATDGDVPFDAPFGAQGKQGKKSRRYKARRSRFLGQTPPSE
jgi:hypothetical protein